MNRLGWATALLALAGWAGAELVRGDDEASGEAVRREIVKLEEQVRRATLANDAKFFRGIWTEDYVRTNASGETSNKPRSLETLRTGLVRYQLLEYMDIDVRIHGDAVVVTGRSRIKSVARGETINGDFRHTRVWIHKPDGWKIVAFHSSRIADD